MCPELGIHTDGGKARDGVDFVEDDFPVSLADKEIDARKALASDCAECLFCGLSELEGDFLRDSSRDVQNGGSVNILGFIGVKLDNRHQLADHTGCLRMLVAQHCGFYLLHLLDAFLNHCLVVLFQCGLAGSQQLAAVMRLAYSYRGTCICRLHKHRVAQLFLCLTGKLLKILHLAFVHYHPLCHLDAVGLQNGVGHLFIHAVCARDCVTADKRNPCQLEQALNGSVLSVFSVQYREADVHLDQLPAVLSQKQDSFMRAVRRNNSGSQASVLFPALAGDFLILSGIFHPASVLGNADSQHLILLRQVFQNRLGRHQRNIVLAGNASEQYGDSGFIFAHKGHSFFSVFSCIYM